MIGAMEKMIGEAQRRGVAVIVASLPPQNPDGSRGNGAEDLPEFSREVERMAADEGAIFLDLFNLLGTWVGYIGIDGLHPTPPGTRGLPSCGRKRFSAGSKSPATPRHDAVHSQVGAGFKPGPPCLPVNP